MKTKIEKIEEKKAEIKNYQRILSEYQGRWWDMGKRHLEALEAELKQLEESPDDLL